MERDFKFQPLPGKVPVIQLRKEIIKDLSTDQHYAYRMMIAIRSGELEMDLACIKPGNICHSRWLTTANTFCQMWVSKHGLKGPLYNRLKDIVTFIVQCYYPTWFQIKVNHSWVDGPRNILYELNRIRTQKKLVQNVVEKVVRSSAWFAHSEPILITMLSSCESAERMWAVDMILKIRGNKNKGDKNIRPRILPLLNIKADKLVDLISWD